MENLLQREGVKDQLKIVIAANDEMALGAIQALKAAGITDVLVGGFDGSADASQAIKAGDLTVTYNTDPFRITSYNVCYTKLLRSASCEVSSFAGSIRSKGRCFWKNPSA